MSVDDRHFAHYWGVRSCVGGVRGGSRGLGRLSWLPSSETKSSKMTHLISFSFFCRRALRDFLPLLFPLWRLRLLFWTTAGVRPVASSSTPRPWALSAKSGDSSMVRGLTRPARRDSSGELQLETRLGLPSPVSLAATGGVTTSSKPSSMKMVSRMASCAGPGDMSRYTLGSKARCEAMAPALGGILVGALRGLLTVRPGGTAGAVSSSVGRSACVECCDSKPGGGEGEKTFPFVVRRDSPAVCGAKEGGERLRGAVFG